MEPEDAGNDEELYPHALEALKSSGYPSTYMIQRSLRISHNQASRIMELMQARGIVGPGREDGLGPRQILVDLDKL